MEAEFGICNLAVVPVRAETSDKSEILSQLLFGECFTVLATEGSWVRIKNYSDDYEGWIDFKQFQILSEHEFLELRRSSRVLGPSVCQTVEKASTGERLLLLPGSSIPMKDNTRAFFLNSEKYQFLSAPFFADSGSGLAKVEEYARFFLNAPYLWGGKSLFGIDCSGFTQVVFKMIGVSLKRDAWQQAEQGETVNFLQEARLGDLAFFDNAEGRIVHVGIMLSNNEIIHASGRVKIDPIDNQGIYSLDLKKHSHSLRIIKRYSGIL